jgi:hypothetical protein
MTDDSTVAATLSQVITRYQGNTWLGFNFGDSIYCGPNPYVPANQATVTYSLHPAVTWLVINPMTFPVNLNNTVTAQKQFSNSNYGTYSTYEMRNATWFTWPSYIHWTFIVNPIGIRNISSEIPEHFVLFQNYPNPFNPSTKIRFSIPEVRDRHACHLQIFDITGREIQTLVNEKLEPGTYEVTFDGSNYSSGVYFYQLQTEDFVQTKKLILLK